MRLLALCGPFDWSHLPECDLQRNWGHQTVPYTAFMLACLIKISEGQGSMGKSRQYLGENPALVCTSCPPLFASGPPHLRRTGLSTAAPTGPGNHPAILTAALAASAGTTRLTNNLANSLRSPVSATSSRAWGRWSSGWSAAVPFAEKGGCKVANATSTPRDARCVPPVSPCRSSLFHQWYQDRGRCRVG